MGSGTAIPTSVVAPSLNGIRLAQQVWKPVLFLHWRIDPAIAARFMPKGVGVDIRDGATYVGLVLTGIGGTRALGRLPIPFIGEYLQANVRLYSVDDHGRHGVFFLELEAQRLIAALAGRLALQPANWTATTRLTGPSGEEHWRMDRRGFRASGHLDLTATVGDPVDHGELEHWLTDRWVGHMRLADGAAWFRVGHEPWSFRSMIIREWKTSLLSDFGLAPDAQPDVPELWSSGVVADIGLPMGVTNG